MHSFRYFLAQLARVVRDGDLEVHAFVLMTSHFHLLTRSPKGRLSAAMQRVQNLFVRHFNRRARRDGPLFRGRFVSKPVESLRYRRVLVRYIDQNPVFGGLVTSPELYPYGSARLHMLGPRPPWLERSWIEPDALDRSGLSTFSATAYRRAYGAPLSTAMQGVVERRLLSTDSRHDALVDLIDAAPARVRAWMVRKAKLADGKPAPAGPGFL